MKTFNIKQKEIIEIVNTTAKTEVNLKKEFPHYYYNNVPDLIKREGKFCRKGDFNLVEMDFIKQLLNEIRYKIEIGHCYHNSQLAVLASDSVLGDTTNKIKYHEGYFKYENNDIIQHGWNTLNKKVIDLTAVLGSERAFTTLSFSEIIRRGEYFGINVGKNFIIDKYLNSKQSISYLFHLNRESVILKRKYNSELLE